MEEEDWVAGREQRQTSMKAKAVVRGGGRHIQGGRRNWAEGRRSVLRGGRSDQDSRVRAEPAGAWVPPAAAAPGKWPLDWDLRARRVRAVEVGGFGRLRPLPGPGAGAGDPGAASAPPTRAKPSLRRGAARPGWEASRQRWRTLRRPEGTGAVPPGPPRRHHRAIGQLVPAASSSCVYVRERRLWSRNQIAAASPGCPLAGSLPPAHRPRGLVLPLKLPRTQ